MSENITYPYNDEYMVVDELTGHYVLTETALLSRGIDLRARLSETSTVSPENVINMNPDTLILGGIDINIWI